MGNLLYTGRKTWGIQEEQHGQALSTRISRKKEAAKPEVERRGEVFFWSSGRDTGLVLQARPLPDDLSCGGEMALSRRCV